MAVPTMSKPLAPRNWRLNKPPDLKSFIPRNRIGGKEIPAFNGSGTSRRNKKRPITLPKTPWN